jgi:hypothetical protein
VIINFNGTAFKAEFFAAVACHEITSLSLLNHASAPWALFDSLFLHFFLIFGILYLNCLLHLLARLAQVSLCIAIKTYLLVALRASMELKFVGVKAK